MEADQQAYAREQTVDAALKRMTRAFADAGLDCAQRDARFLLQGILGIDGAVLLTQPQRQLGALADRVGDAVRRRLAHEPISRILGMREFYGRDFIVTPDVLDPRPDTEAVVELALEIVKSTGLEGKALEIADIGTGSGILIATLLAELSGARGVATDISPAALAVAKRNVDLLGVGDRTTFVATRGLDGCAGPFDLIVSNPPYIATNDIKGLDPEVRGYDPLLALDGGPDGLSVYREFARDLTKQQPSARLVVEFCADQATDVQKIFHEAGWHVLARKTDLGGHVRAVALEIHPLGL
jgi:release factor glutamine methyltransferase